MCTPRRRSSVAALLALAGLLAFAVPAWSAISEWRSVLGARPKAAAQPVVVVLAAPSLADRVASARTKPTRLEERRWTREAAAGRQAFLSALSRRGVRIRPDLTFTRTLNGFSATLDARALAEVERAPGVLGVYPVRTVYPASASARVLAAPEFSEDGGRRPAVSLPGRDGSGVVIALLDTGVDLTHPYLRGRLLPGWDVVGGDRRAAAESKPGDPERVEAHGTRMAGLLVGANGPAGLRGVAPGARILPIRVLGWQPTQDGSHAVIGRGDQFLAGLERAVDPNGDGDAHDAVRIALAALFEPYASFADSPEARAVDGAARLGTLVVAAAGNDGPAGAGFGSIGAPGGAAAALTAGALDLRRYVLALPTSVQAAGRDLLDRPTRLLGAIEPGVPMTLRLVPLLEPARGPELVKSGRAAADFFDTGGRSLVEGAAVLLPADARSLVEKARNAAAAGAALLAVYGTILPTGGLDLEDVAPLPVVALPAPVGRAVIAAGEGSISIAPAEQVANPVFRTVPSFSSRGLALDGSVKPEVVAAGVGLATADAGRNPDGAPRYATVTGTSVAAALVAGAAALVAEARPKLGPAALKGALVGSARPATADPATAQGAGVVDPVAATAAEFVVEPAALAFGRTDGRPWRRVRVVSVRNLSAARLRVQIGAASSAGVTISVRPRTLTLRPGGVREVRIVARAPRGAGGLASGALLLRSATRVVRVPWAVALGSARRGALVSDVSLEPTAFAPSLDEPAVLAFSAGRIQHDGNAGSIDPVALLELELWHRGRRLGVVTRLRDLLPGSYAVGLTGRGPDGKLLPPGRYVVRLKSRPVDGASPSDVSVEQAIFTIVRPAREP